MSEEKDLTGTVEARKCECCGHHELGIHEPDDGWIPLRPGDTVTLHRKEEANMREEILKELEKRPRIKSRVGLFSSYMDALSKVGPPTRESPPKVIPRKNRYEVFIDDNYHALDESERVFHAAYNSCEEAVAGCKKIVDDFLQEEFKKGMTAEGLYDQYKFGGPDPFIVEKGGSSTSDVIFSAWNYAKQRCKEITGQSERKEDNG